MTEQRHYRVAPGRLLRNKDGSVHAYAGDVVAADHPAVLASSCDGDLVPCNDVLFENAEPVEQLPTEEDGDLISP